MDLPRLTLFEFNDSPWAPRVLRETIIEALSRTLEWGGILRGLVAPFERFVEASGATEILDLASGAGGPARILVREIERAGRKPPRFLLTDLNPEPEVWEALRAAFPGVIDYLAEPIDATAIPASVSRGRARVIINAFHHLPPDIARGVLADAVANRAPIFIAEGFDRDPRGFASMAPVGLAALAMTPILSPHDRLQKALFAYSSPALLIASAWDGVVSTLRVYDRADLEAMVAPLGEGYAWTFGHYTFPVRGRGHYFYGVPKPM